ncbi:MAG: hypothetical protein ACK5NG_10545, partial [Chthoniobacterales bacterium]
LVAAYRLPNNAFKDNAGAEVEETANKGTAGKTTAEKDKNSQKKTKIVKGDILKKRVLEARKEPTKANTLQDAFGISLGLAKPC